MFFFVVCMYKLEERIHFRYKSRFFNFHSFNPDCNRSISCFWCYWSLYPLTVSVLSDEMQQVFMLNVRSISSAIIATFNLLTAILTCRGSSPGASDNSGKTPLQILVDKGAISDEELFSMLSKPNR